MTYNGYTASQLFAAAKVAGIALYGEPYLVDGWLPQGLVFYDDDTDVTILDATALGSEDPDEQDGDAECAFADDYEYEFFPSTGKGADVACDPIRQMQPDVDGCVYLYGPGYGIRIIRR